MQLDMVLYTASTWVLPVLLAITLHEAAHALVAHRLGDDTAYRLGRVTLNPLKHVDLFTVVVFAIAISFRVRETGAGQLWRAPPAAAPSRDRERRAECAHFCGAPLRVASASPIWTLSTTCGFRSAMAR